jgi:Calcineurin-like phosphoesterase
MASIRWLHLTDLHVGMPGMSPLWPSVKEYLYRDLEEIHRIAGPFDLVLFSGDLVQSGQDAEYEELAGLLDDLWRHFGKLGSSPVLLAVPGNHDLARPKDSSAAVRRLLNWAHDQDLRGTDFWDEKRGREYRRVIDPAFKGYMRWWRARGAAHPLPGWVEQNVDGLLPGDFAATIRKDGVSLGVVGLNTSFLQLSGKIGRGNLALHPSQLNRVCGGDPGAWAEKHDVCLLMTHHPPEWLAPDALAYYQSAIFLPQWFAAHGSSCAFGRGSDGVIRTPDGGTSSLTSEASSSTSGQVTRS